MIAEKKDEQDLDRNKTIEIEMMEIKETTK